MCGETTAATATAAGAAAALPWLGEGQRLLVLRRRPAAALAADRSRHERKRKLVAREDPASDGWVEEGSDVLAVETLFVEGVGVSVFVVG